MNEYIPPNHSVIGTCSMCGGAVIVPTVWWSVVPPTPQCSPCGAFAAQNGPVIPMQPRDPPPPYTWKDTTGWPILEGPTSSCIPSPEPLTQDQLDYIANSTPKYHRDRGNSIQPAV